MPKLAPLRISTGGQEVELVEPAVFGRKNAVGSGGAAVAWEIFAKKRSKIAQRHFRFWRDVVTCHVGGVRSDAVETGLLGRRIVAGSNGISVT